MKPYTLILGLVVLLLTSCASQPPAPAPTPTPPAASQKLQINAAKRLATFDPTTWKIEYEKDATPEDVIKVLVYENVQMGQKLQSITNPKPVAKPVSLDKKKNLKKGEKK
jgi:hypothetical protein